MTRTYETIRVDLGDPVATVTLARPDALNAITPAMLDELIDAFTELSAAGGPAVIVLTGEGRAFCAGVDLKALAGRSLANGKVGDVLDVPARRLTSLLTTIEAVVIAKVNGPCFTGGLELALACDLVVTANEAILGDTHAKFGLRPTWGMSSRLPLAVGATRARLLSYTAQTFTGADAATWGLAAVACPRDDLDATVADLAARIAANSRGSLAAYKDLYRVGADATLTEGLAHEAATEYPIDDTEPRIASFR